MSDSDVRFRVTLIDPSGRITCRSVDAADALSACQVVGRQGYEVLACKEVALGMRGLAHWARSWHLGSTPKLDTVMLALDMATMLEAGVTVKDAVNTMARKESSRRLRKVYEGLDLAVSQGRTFSQALKQSQVFPQLLVATVAASEQTGDLAIGLSRYAKHQHGLRLLRDRVVGACTYPALLLMVGAAVVLILLGVVVPRFAVMIDSSGRQLPWLSQVLMEWGRFISAHTWVPWTVLVLLALLTGYGIAQWRSAKARKRWLAAIPGLARLAREFQHLQMYRTAAILTARGIPFHKALDHCGELLGVQDQQRLQAAIEHMNKGISISRALDQAGFSDGLATSMLAVAERTGSLSEMLDRIADSYERALQRRIDIASRLVEPLLMILIGVAVGAIVILMYLPIFDLASSIS